MYVNWRELALHFFVKVIVKLLLIIILKSDSTRDNFLKFLEVKLSPQKSMWWIPILVAVFVRIDLPRDVVLQVIVTCSELESEKWISSKAFWRRSIPLVTSIKNFGIESLFTANLQALTNEDQLKTSPGFGENHFEKNLQGQERKELFRKTKKVLIEICNIHHIYCLVNCLVNLFSTAQKMKFSITNFFSKCDQIRRFLRIWSHLLRKSVMENFIFCAVFF